MIPKNALPVALGSMTFAACATTATLGHYASEWVVSYFVGAGFSIGAGLVVLLMTSDEL